jgi:hypothetical protein
MNFWPDLDPATVIDRNPNRQFIGEDTAFNGNWSGGDASYGLPDWLPREALIYVTQPCGRTGIVVGTKTSNITTPTGNPTWADASIAIAGVAINDSVGQGAKYSWAGYFEAWREPGASAVFGIEIDVGNFGANDVETPYVMFGDGVFGLNIASGGSTFRTPANPASSALQIANNTGTFNTGIIVGATAIEGTDGVTGQGTAVALAKGHQVEWYSAAYQPPVAAVGCVNGSGAELYSGSQRCIEARDPTATLETGMLLAINRSGTVTVEKVKIGAANSGGSGKRALVVNN